MASVNSIPQYYCTAADSRFFPRLINLIGSIHQTNFNNLVEISVFNLGLTKNEINQLERMEKVKLYNIEMTNPNLLTLYKTDRAGKAAKGYYAWKPVAIRQILKEFPYVLWIDTGTTVLKPLDQLFEYIQENGYFLQSLPVQPCHNIINRITKTVLEKIVFKLPINKQKKILHANTVMIDAGLQGISRKVLNDYINPMYEFSKNLKLFEDDGSARTGFGQARHDQMLFSILAHALNYKIHPFDQFEIRTSKGNFKFNIPHLGVGKIKEKSIIYRSRTNIKFQGGKTEFIRYKTRK